MTLPTGDSFSISFFADTNCGRTRLYTDCSLRALINGKLLITIRTLSGAGGGNGGSLLHRGALLRPSSLYYRIGEAHWVWGQRRIITNRRKATHIHRSLVSSIPSEIFHKQILKILSNLAAKISIGLIFPVRADVYKKLFQSDFSQLQKVCLVNWTKCFGNYLAIIRSIFKLSDKLMTDQDVVANTGWLCVCFLNDLKSRISL